jgi:hypothetical protein
MPNFHDGPQSDLFTLLSFKGNTPFVQSIPNPMSSFNPFYS